MSDELFKHSSVMFISIAIANVFAYLFHIFIARSLGPASYGEFGSLLAIFMILSVPVATIQTVITKFVAGYKSKKEYGKIGSLTFSAIKKLLLYGFGAFLIISILSPLIANFLHIESFIPVIIVGITVIFSVILPVNRGVLQGIQKFNDLALNNVLESIFRLIFGVILIIIGFGVSGALLGFGLGYLFAFLFAFIPLNYYFNKRDDNINVKEIYRYIKPVFIAVLLINLLVNLPTIFIKHFYSSEFTGLWNVSLTLARIILFLATAISLVMFAKVSSSSNSLEKKKLFKNSLIYVILGSLIVSLIFFFFSKEILVILFGSAYSNGAIILKWMGFGISLIAVLQLKVYYKLGMKN